MNSYLELEQLGKRYGSTTALAGVDLSIGRGNVVALLGPNGAGKSTLFGCLLGFVHASSGRILIKGNPVDDTIRCRFGYLSERVSLYPQRTVWENSLFFAQLKDQTAAEIERQLKRVGLDNVRDRKARQLSKGMLQRLGLAIALCGQPELLVLDEPFNGLDPALLESLQNILREENNRGATLLISTHTMSAVEPLATHVAILLEGKLKTFASLEILQREHGESSLEEVYQQIARSNRADRQEVGV